MKDIKPQQTTLFATSLLLLYSNHPIGAPALLGQYLFEWIGFNLIGFINSLVPAAIG